MERVDGEAYENGYAKDGHNGVRQYDGQLGSAHGQMGLVARGRSETKKGGKNKLSSFKIHKVCLNLSSRGFCVRHGSPLQCFVYLPYRVPNKLIFSNAKFRQEPYCMAKSEKNS